jgi:hypothetical protein
VRVSRLRRRGREQVAHATAPDLDSGEFPGQQCPAIAAGDAVQNGLRLLRSAAVKEIVRRFRQPEAQPEADHGRQGGQDEQPTPSLFAGPLTGPPGTECDADGADGPEAFERDQPAAAPFGWQKLGHHGIVHRQGAADADAGQQAQDQQHLEVRREGRSEPENRIDQYGDDQHAAATEPVGKPAEAPGADQHAQKERGSGLHRRRNRQAELGRDGRRREADRQNLHGIGCPDQTENGQQTIMKRTGTDSTQRLIDDHCRHVLPSSQRDRTERICFCQRTGFACLSSCWTGQMIISRVSVLKIWTRETSSKAWSIECTAARSTGPPCLVVIRPRRSGVGRARSGGRGRCGGRNRRSLRRHGARRRRWRTPGPGSPGCLLPARGRGYGC